jgi:hypothetical protein
LLEHIIKIWRFGKNFIKINWRTHRIEGSVTFYGITIQEETTGHQGIWAICSINSLIWHEIVLFKSQLGRNLLLEESLVRPTY